MNPQSQYNMKFTHTSWSVSEVQFKGSKFWTMFMTSGNCVLSYAQRWYVWLSAQKSESLHKSTEREEISMQITFGSIGCSMCSLEVLIAYCSYMQSGFMKSAVYMALKILGTFTFIGYYPQLLHRAFGYASKYWLLREHGCYLKNGGYKANKAYLHVQKNYMVQPFCLWFHLIIQSRIC